MICPLVRELAAAGAPVRVPVAVTCRVLKAVNGLFDGSKLDDDRWLDQDGNLHSTDC